MIQIKKQWHKGVILIAIVASVAVLPLRTHAVTTENIMAQIRVLLAQIQVLQQRVDALQGVIVGEYFVDDLRFGMRESDAVRRAQQFLIGQGVLDAGLATGNFLLLTEAAMRRFQQESGLPMTGVFDVATREVANVLLWPENLEDKGVVRQAATSTERVADFEYQLSPRPVYNLMELESAAFDVVNREREENGLRALVWSDAVAAVARAHSADQAKDNVTVTDPDVACVYPLIRHEGFVSGFGSGNRLEWVGVSYRIAGENIIILPLTKDLVYRADEPAPACAEASELTAPTGETQEAARVRIANILNERVALMIGQEKLQWINRAWRTAQEVAMQSATDWMNSPGHRRNILTPEFEEGGMGAAIVNDYIILTHVFLKRP